jgi:hypothetical protein
VTRLLSRLRSLGKGPIRVAVRTGALGLAVIVMAVKTAEMTSLLGGLGALGEGAVGVAAGVLGRGGAAVAGVAT